MGHDPDGPELEQLLDAEYRLARLEARWESRGTVLMVLVLVATVAWALWSQGVLNFNPGAIRA